MILLNAAAMREADRLTIEKVGFPGIALMENAGMRITEAVLAMEPLPRRVAIVAGPGNNGGDGLVTARHLHKLGLEVLVWTLMHPADYRGDAAVNMKYLDSIEFNSIQIQDSVPLGMLMDDLGSADLVIDALFGTGSVRPLEGLAAQVVDVINFSGTPVLAVDIPSGIDADTGRVLGKAVKAWWTVTLAYPKTGLMLHPGADYAGRVSVAEIYIPDLVVTGSNFHTASSGNAGIVEVITADLVYSLLPERPRNAHKGTFGRALVVAGSKGMTGAAVLTAEAVLRGGAGLVYLAVAHSLHAAIEAKLVEVISKGISEAGTGIISPEGAGEILQLAGDCRVLAVGPGLDPGKETGELVKTLVKKSPVPLILDAGALGAAAAEPEILQGAKTPLIITPHTGEMARLTGLSTGEVEEQRLTLPAKTARARNMVVVLKGSPTVVALPDGKTYVNTTGGPALSTAGTGDLLTGLIAALLSQGLSPGDGALAGVFMHGLAGDITSAAGRGVKAGDILLRFPAAFDILENRKWQPSPFGPFHQELRKQWLED